MPYRVEMGTNQAMSSNSSSVRRFEGVARDLDLAIAIVEMAESTRTAQEAATACGCDVGQIVKSLIFLTKESVTPVLLLVSGDNQVDQSNVAALIGEPLVRPDAKFVKQTTGFSIGGVPPFGHTQNLKTYIDRDLLLHETVWAAAGSPKAVFSISSAALKDVAQATVIAVC